MLELKVAKIEGCQFEVCQIESCQIKLLKWQNWKWPKSKIVKVENCQFWKFLSCYVVQLVKLPKMKIAKIDRLVNC